ncbi:MAG: glycosyltransferase family 39 protein [Anaerolineales bacterium]|nr:glycosyltransferase family 39 protein [Anaerolineales bacterium]
MQQSENLPPEQEPTVLDLYKSATKDWNSFSNFLRSLWDVRKREELNASLTHQSDEIVIVEEKAIEPNRSSAFPWLALLALVLALIAQALVEPPQRQSMLSVIFYLGAFGVAIWSYRKDEWHLPTMPAIRQMQDPLYTRLIPLIIAVVCAGIAFYDFKDGLFNWVNTTLWILSIIFLAVSLWVNYPKIKTEENIVEATKEIKFGGVFISVNQNVIKWIARIITLLIVGLVLFYRLYQVDTVPIEPFSDHAEKILDVYELSQGKTSVFFERNTGREAFQFYWTLLVINIFNTGFSFYSLKLGTALLGILTLPFVYQLGKEFGNQRVAIFFLFLFGIAAWPNIISRIGLRFPLYPLFVAPTLLYLVRGLRTHNRNDFILAGIFLGLGLHGYSPFRMMPFLVVATFVLYLLHLKAKENVQQTIWWFLIVVAVSVFVFLPLGRYWMERPDLFGYRALSRLGDIETPLPGPAWQIFLSNLYNGLLMFNWDDGQIWVNSVTDRPALDLITAALFLLGVVLLIVRYIRQRDWRDLLLLVAIPILIMPSVLSLAYPGENPALNRAGGASVVVILVATLALDGFVTSFGSGAKRKFIAYGLTGILLAASAFSNFDLVFNQFAEPYRKSAWNTSEMGKVISDFRDEYGQTDTVWIVPYPYWVDTRLPGVWAGIPDRDFALFPERLHESLAFPAPKMFIYWNVDTETEKILRELYPNGEVSRYTSAFDGKDFYIFLVEE